METKKEFKLHQRERERERERERREECSIFIFFEKRGKSLLTYAATEWGQWFVVEAEQLGDVVKVWMLDD
jgi:predicted RNA-binding protein (virulence factor B family)